MSVSRRHCFINNEEGRFKISDLGSRNGTIVNGLPVKEQILEPGSRVQIGEFRFLFLMEEKEAARLSTQVQIDDRTLVPRSSLQLHKGDTLYFQPEVISATLPPTAEQLGTSVPFWTSARSSMPFENRMSFSRSCWNWFSK